MISNNNETKFIKPYLVLVINIKKDAGSWEIQSELFTHDKVQKLFEYENSWLKYLIKKYSICLILIILIHPLKENLVF